MKNIKQNNKKIKKYYILESGEYSSYSVDFIEVPNKLKITKKEIEFVLNLDKYNGYSISGEIIGELKGWEPMILKSKLGGMIDSLFSCYEDREVKTILDRVYSQVELLDIATKNDSSGIDYWKRKIGDIYQDYLKAFEIYKTL